MRTFPVNSPKIATIEIKRHGRVRRAKLFYLRERTGKATRLRERKAKPWEVDPNAKEVVPRERLSGSRPCESLPQTAQCPHETVAPQTVW